MEFLLRSFCTVFIITFILACVNLPAGIINYLSLLGLYAAYDLLNIFFLFNPLTLTYSIISFLFNDIDYFFALTCITSIQKIFIFNMHTSLNKKKVSLNYINE